MNIITAITNPEINKKLKQEKEFNIIGNDIFYQEGIIEIIEKNKNINLIIISDLIITDKIEFIKILNKIKNKNIEIIAIINEKNIEIKNILFSEGFFDIFFNNKISINELINFIKNKNNKKIILKENKTEKSKIKNKTIILNNKIKNKIIKNKKINNKIISITGNNSSGKSIFCAIISLILKNKKILIIDFNNSINSIFGIKINKKEITRINKNIDLINYKEENKINNFGKICDILENKKNIYDVVFIDINQENKYLKEIIEKTNIIIYLLEPNIIELKKIRENLNIFINKWKIKKEKINIIFNKININSIDINILKNIFSDFKILGKIKNNNYYNLIINRNIKIINKKIKKEYKKIINKII